VCVLHRLADGICLCKLNQINAQVQEAQASHYVEILLWNRVWTCCKTDNRMNEYRLGFQLYCSHKTETGNI
jgi:hypothetical protein